MIEPLKAKPLKAALAAFMDVPPEAISFHHDTEALRRAVARAIRAYRDNEAGLPAEVQSQAQLTILRRSAGV
jgi:hypothetical protein